MPAPVTAASKSISTYRPRWGGKGGPGTNPEQLFATGYAACFQSALLRFAFGRKLDLTSTRVTARVGIGTLENGGLGLGAALDLDAPQISRDEAIELIDTGARGLPLLTRDTRQHRRHAHGRRRADRRTPSGLNR
jgi:organic hydroperoxide reductase OsmC/OhrA